MLRHLIREMLLFEKKSGRATLQSLKNRIARDIMSLINDRLERVSVGVEALDPSEYSQFPISQIEKAHELYGYDWKKKIDTSGLSAEELEDYDWDEIPKIDVSVVVIRDPARKEFNVGGYSVTALDTSGIDVIIELPQDFPPQKYESLREEIGNTVLHELEHLTQDEDFKSYGRDESYYEVDFPYDPESEYAKNKLLTPKEISAHVIGYSDTATSLQDLQSRIETDAATYFRKGLITKLDMELVSSVYMDWAKRNLKSKKFNI